MRVGKTLRDIERFLGQRKIIIFRELTKKFEEVQTGETSELIKHFENKPPKGEFVIMILPAALQRGKPAIMRGKPNKK